MKKAMAMLLAMTIAFGLTACGGGQTGQTSGGGAQSSGADSEAQSAESNGGTPEPMELSIMNWDIGDSFSDDGTSDRMLDFVQDKFNITIKPVNVSWDDAGEKATTWAAAGSLPDVIGAVALPGSGQFYQWINDGVVRALPEDLSAYPEVKRNVAQPEVQAYAIDGRNYFLPRQTYPDASWWCMDRGIINRKDWREQLGIGIPKTEQDFIDMWAAYSNSDPNGDGSVVYGMSPNTRWPLQSQTMTTFGYTSDNWMKMDDGSIVLPVMEKSTLPLMSFYRRAFAAGGIHPDFVTALSDDALEWFVAGQIGTLLRQTSPKHMKRIFDDWNKVQKDKDYFDCIEILHPPEVPGVKPVRFGEKAYWSETYINSAVDDVKMAKILEFYDYFYTDEAMKLLLYGFEGEDYKMDGNEVVMLTEVNPDTGMQKTAGEIYRFAYGGMNWLVSWPGDYLQYVDPSIPEGIREMCTIERNYRIANWEAPNIDYRISAIDVPEKGEMSAVSYNDDWAAFIVNTSDAADEELYEQMYANWEVNGYKAAKDALTKKVAELGY